MLIEFILWDQRLLKGFVLRNILGTKVLLNYIFSVLNFVLIFLLINIENIYSLLLVSLLILSRYAWLVTEIGGSCPRYENKTSFSLEKTNKFQLSKTNLQKLHSLH